MNITALLAGLASGLIGSMGLGGGAVLIIYLNLFTDTPQLKAQGINLIFFIPIAVAAVLIYTKQKRIKWKTAIYLAAFGLLGAGLGTMLVGAMGGEITGKIFGAMLIIMGLRETFAKNLEKNNK